MKKPKALIEETLALPAWLLARNAPPGGTLASGVSYGYDYNRHQLALQYTVDGEPQEDLVLIERTPCHYGLDSYRQWFLCPFCDRRRRQLFLTAGRWLFACRDCCGLGYKVWRLQPIGRLARRLERARSRCPAVRPRYMHWKIWQNRHYELLKAEQDLLVAVAKRMSQTKRKSSRLARRRTKRSGI